MQKPSLLKYQKETERADLEHQTIAAIATANSAAGIGIVRISGPDAKVVADRVFRAVSKTSVSDMPGYRATFGRCYDSDGDIDDAVCLVFNAPKSYTGEDVVEISVHGGVYILRRLLRAVLSNGARPAAAGEFTKRAFLNGKLSLTQAEAVMDLIASTGIQSQRAALAVADGRLSKMTDEISSRLISIAGHISAWVDYPEEDIEELGLGELKSDLIDIRDQINVLIKGFDTGRILREGVDTAIIGSPNVGKSSLMNVLSGYQKSIVTEIAGTTRDIIEDTVTLGDVTLRLSDTAGIRQSDDPVEAVGVKRAKDRLESAGLILAVFDGSRELSQTDLEIINVIKNRPCIAVINKIDLDIKICKEYIEENIKHIVYISAELGKGIDTLEAEIRAVLEINNLDEKALLLTTERQLSCALSSLSDINKAIEALEMGYTLDATEVMIEGAIESLLELSGKNATAAVVDEVFSHFCVGK